MTITEIMDREVRDATTKALAENVIRHRAEKAERWPLGAVLMLALCGIMALATAYAFGYWKCSKDDLRRQQEQWQRDDETEARIDAEVRAMSNAELIAATEKIAAKYKNHK